MSWHVDASVIGRYQEGGLDRAAAASVEAHVAGCGQCRRQVTFDEGRLERSWMAVVERVEPSRPGLVERGLAVLGVPAHVARIVAVSPALRVSFVLAVVLVTGFAAAVSTSNPTGGTYKLFLVLAPLLPVAGVAIAYGRLVDPVHELTMVSPIDSFRLLLLRTTTVLAVSITVGLLAWPLVPAPSSLGVSAWLIPAMALTLVTLAMSSQFELWLSGSVVAGGWVLMMLLAHTERIEAFGSAAQTGYAALAGIAAAAVITRRDRYDREGSRR
ncbi:hypothetical protein BH23ACT5_BH23ACT5_11130 [soil metagenome]